MSDGSEQECFANRRKSLSIYSVTNMNHLKRNVRTYAIWSRLLFISLSAMVNLVIPDHKALNVFRTPALRFDSFSSADGIVYALTGGLIRWDSHHYLHIASAGYTYENNLAFFPLYPIIVSLTNVCLKAIFGSVVNTATMLILAAVGVNFYFFIKATVALFDLTMVVFKDPTFAYKTSVFFCLSPATIFFVAPYTESLFAFLTFKGMHCSFKSQLSTAALWFSLAGCVRSNGLLNLGFIAYSLIYRALNLFHKNQLLSFKSIEMLIDTFLCGVSCTILIILPYLAFQLYGFYTFCFKRDISDYPKYVVDYAIENSLIMPSNITDWCESQLPFPYFNVQRKYWNVGFTKYFELRQLPNFILAFPMIILILYNGFKFLQKNLFIFEKPEVSVWPRHKKLNTLKLPHSILPYCIHAMFLTVYAFFFINVQVVTRLLASSNPFIYWVAACQFILYLKDYDKYKKKSNNKTWKIFPFGEISLRKQGNIIKLYFVVYITLGIILFSNNYPWT